MKQTKVVTSFFFSIAMIATLILAGCASSPAPSEQMPMPDRSLYQVQSGEMVIKELPGITAHSYVMPDGNTATILETENSLIVLDMVGSEELGQEFSGYIESLVKPVSRVYLSHNHDHHLVMAAALMNAPMYTLDSAMDSFSDIDTGMYTIPTETVSIGMETVDGIAMEYMAGQDGTILYIAFPEQKMIWTQHLLYSQFHLPMIGAPVEMMLASVEGYDYYIASHGQPAGPEIIGEFLAYQAFANQAVANAANADAAIAAIQMEYPDYGGAGLLNLFIPPAFMQ